MIFSLAATDGVAAEDVEVEEGVVGVWYSTPGETGGFSSCSDLMMMMMMTFISQGGEGQRKTNKKRTRRKATKSKGFGRSSVL